MYSYVLSRQRDNINLNQTDRIRIFSDEAGNAKIVIKDVQAADVGLYFCIAENKEGKAKCAATLRIIGEKQHIYVMQHKYYMIQD